MKKIRFPWYILALIIPLVLFTRPLSTPDTFFFRDTFSFFYPMKHFLAQQVRDGQIPLWNPYLSCGTPFLANMQSGFLYLPSIIFYVLPFYFAFKFFIILHYSLACLFFFLMMRGYGCTGTGSFMGAVIFSMGGYLVSLHNTLNNLQSVVWIPLIIFFYEAYGVKGGKRFLVAGMVASAIQMTGGEMMVVMLTWGFLAGLYISEILPVVFNRGDPRVMRRKCIAFILIFVTGLLLASAQVMPGLEFAAHSQRSEGFELRSAAFMSTEPVTLLNFLYPRTFYRDRLPGTLFLERQIPWLLSIYGGVAGLSFFFYAGCLLRKPRITYLYVVFVAGMLLAMGKYTPVFTWIYTVFQPLRFFRVAEKFFLLAVLSSAMLVSFGWDRYWSGARHGKPFRMFAGVFVFFGILFLTVTWYRFHVPELHQHLITYYHGLGVTPYLDDMVTILMTAWDRALLFWGALVLLFIYPCVARTRHGTAKTLFIILCVLDLFLAHRYLPGYANGESFTPQSGIDENLSRNGYAERIYSCAHDSAGRDEDIFRYYYNGCRLLFPDMSLYFRFYDASEKDVLTLKPNYDLRFVIDHGPDKGKTALLDALGVKYYMTYKPFSDPSWKETLHLQPEGLRIYTCQRTPGRITVYPLKNAVPAQTPEIMRALMIREDFPQSGMVTVSDSLLNTSVIAGDTGADERTPEPFRISAYTPAVIDFEGTMNEDGLLLLNDSYYPGWKAFRQNVELPVFRANYCFRALLLGGGTHAIRLVYYPESFRMGAYVTMITLLVLVAAGTGGMSISRKF